LSLPKWANSIEGDNTKPIYPTNTQFMSSRISTLIFSILRKYLYQRKLIKGREKEKGKH